MSATVDHAAESERLLEHAQASGGDATHANYAAAQVHATLALAEQQKRTADIIDMLIGNNAYALNVAVRA